MTTQEKRLAEIRKAIDAENVSLGELSELQDLAATHPQLFADDPALAEAAGIPEKDWQKMTDSKTRWTVSPYYTPHEDADPLGVFRIKEVEAEAQKWEDTLPDTAPGSEEEQSALDRREAVTESARRLIAAAPDMLEALRQTLFWLGSVADDLDAGGLWGDEEQDTLERLEKAIAKAEWRAGE